MHKGVMINAPLLHSREIGNRIAESVKRRKLTGAGTDGP